jgi:hypothetical protein
MKAPPKIRGCTMSERDGSLKKILEEFKKFQMTMEELHFLRQVSNDLKSFREMLKLKKYD